MGVLLWSRDYKTDPRHYKLTHQTQSTNTSSISSLQSPFIASSHPNRPPQTSQNRIHVTVRYSLSMHRLCLDIFQPVTLFTKIREIKIGWKRWTSLLHTKARAVDAAVPTASRKPWARGTSLCVLNNTLYRIGQSREGVCEKDGDKSTKGWGN